MKSPLLFLPQMSLPAYTGLAIRAAHAVGQIASYTIQSASEAVENLRESKDSEGSFAEIFAGQTDAESTSSVSLDSIRESLGQFLRELGLEPGSEISLQWESDQLQVASDHPRAAELEDQLSQNSALMSDLRHHFQRSSSLPFDVTVATANDLIG
ncbi:hypothetical protein LOC71_07405 [Rhodopirellula sp. JC740]|uniref:Uncharacterized protein n=1 Tax=Rhodopirellula halodulae TaxID=2894198 RepID=A0ABS8NEW6_9BACT|nr:hypothetical protein [Rhodopirellula sp. JC740]MCC9642095.1 hypothetical protein [Rhodopirellula sp. JC740]